MEELEEEIVFKHIFEAPTRKYRRILYLGFRTKYPCLESKLRADTETTVKMEIMNVGISPILLVWEDPTGERKYSEATINRPTKKINRI
jgi:hypothetical protein